MVLDKNSEKKNSIRKKMQKQQFLNRTKCRKNSEKFFMTIIIQGNDNIHCFNIFSRFISAIIKSEVTILNRQILYIKGNFYRSRWNYQYYLCRSYKSGQ